MYPLPTDVIVCAQAFAAHPAYYVRLAGRQPVVVLRRDGGPGMRMSCPDPEWPRCRHCGGRLGSWLPSPPAGPAVCVACVGKGRAA